MKKNGYYFIHTGAELLCILRVSAVGYSHIHSVDSVRAVGPLRHKSLIILSILFILSAFFSQALHTETLKAPFRLLWEKSGSGMLTCNSDGGGIDASHPD
ncbi:MAG: hypothetical protein AB9903_24025 [Vulcanimicrobiota bacterium]